MLKFLTRASLTLPVMVVIFFLFQVDRKKALKDATCKFSADHAYLKDLLDTDTKHPSGMHLALHIDPRCDLCGILLSELSRWDLEIAMIVVIESHQTETAALLDQWPWCTKPLIVLGSKKAIDKIFCGTSTPTLMIFQGDSLLHHQSGIGNMEYVRKIFHSS